MAMDNLLINKAQSLGYIELVCDIFSTWENVKDEILPPERKQGTGNGTIHVFLGAADKDLRKEFLSYYDAVEHGEDPSVKAVNVKHYFMASNVVSAVGFLCKYCYDKGENIDSNILPVLSYLQNANDEEGMMTTTSLFKLSTGSNRLRPYFKQFDSNGVFSKLIRQLLLPNSCYKISLYKNEEGEYAAFWLIGFSWQTDFEANTTNEYFEAKKDESIIQKSLQQIFYGAPGTGKSNTINEITKKQPKENVFRTTFHPDSDYSTFVGCYKPSMAHTIPKYDIGVLINKLSEIKSSGVSYPCHKFAAKYWESLKDLSVNDIKSILVSCGFTDSMNVEISKGVAIGQDFALKAENKKIIYSYIPQAFTKAYLRAWQTEESVYLIIEEINRGNCAQIFGDLFQLLDRKNGVSEYAIKPDTDLGNFIAENMEAPVEGIPESVKNGEEMILPKNLYIWATMNTSDQSLFPIDSAFKRRWDWKYIKIKEGTDENGNKLNWKVDVVIDDNGEQLIWWNFLQKINEIVASMTSSADKQLGYFFCKANNTGLVEKDTFVSKVIFYLWNDVFKDYGFEDASLFRFTDNEGNEKDLTFSDFFDEDGENVDSERLKDFVKKVMNWKKPNEEKD